MTRTEMKRELISQIAKSLKSFGYKVYISKSKEYGFYTDGLQVVCFGGQWSFYVDFGGNYISPPHSGCGTGWQIAKEMSSITKDLADEFIKAPAPHWATRGVPVILESPEHHLQFYSSSFYEEFEPDPVPTPQEIAQHWDDLEASWTKPPGGMHDCD